MVFLEGLIKVFIANTFANSFSINFLSGNLILDSSACKCIVTSIVVWFNRALILISRICHLYN